MVEDWERPGWLELRKGGEMGQQGRGWFGKASWAVARNWWGVCVCYFLKVPLVTDLRSRWIWIHFRV